jgi:hypothetical protein
MPVDPSAPEGLVITPGSTRSRGVGHSRVGNRRVITLARCRFGGGVVVQILDHSADALASTDGDGDGVPQRPGGHVSTGTLSPIEASGDPSTIDTVMALPDKGAGIYYSLPSQGVSLQLGARGVMLALLGCDLVHIYNPAALGIMLPASLGVGGLAIFAGGMWNLRLGQTIAGTIGGLYGAFWFSFGLLLLTQAAPLTKAVGPAGFDHALAAYLIIWMVVSAFLCIRQPGGVRPAARAGARVPRARHRLRRRSRRFGDAQARRLAVPDRRLPRPVRRDGARDQRDRGKAGAADPLSGGAGW